jgi:N utilization substance protein A
MSKEIVEAVRGLAAEKNISSEKLMEALEDALLSAYKKTPGSARYAKVEMDRDSADFIVWELKIPPELEERLLVARDRPREAQGVRGPDRDRGRHAARLRQDRGPDRQAGDPPADP